MPRVHAAPAVPTSSPSTHAATLVDFAAYVCLVGSICFSVYATVTMAMYMENDYFWPSFHTSSMRSALVAIYRDQWALTSFRSNDTTEASRPVNLLNVPTLAGNGGLSAQSSHGRRLMYTELTGLEQAITSLRSLQVPDVTYMSSQYCWVDLDRSWELAHTAARQARCVASDMDNAAVYLEAILRNIDMASWWSMYQTVFMSSIGNAVLEMPTGGHWLTHLTSHAWVAIDEEASLWRQRHGLARFTLQWTNRITTALLDAISVENAAGTLSQLTLQEVGLEFRRAMWTSVSMFGTLENDIWSVFSGNLSLVRQSAAFYEPIAPQAIESYVVPLPLTLLNQVLHDSLGPLGSVDLRLLAPPLSLLHVVRQMQAALASHVATNATVEALFDSIEAVDLHPVPRKWHSRDLAFTGGSPLCTNGVAQPYVQASFGFDDSCSFQPQLRVTWQRLNALFGAIVATTDGTKFDAAVARQACLDWSTAPTLCTRHVGTVWALADHFRPLVDDNQLHEMVVQVASSPIAIMQFVVNKTLGGVSLQSQPLLAGGHPADAAWRYVWWSSMYEWAVGDREVVAYDGDVQSLVLLSAMQISVGSDAAAAVTKNFATSVFILACATPVMLGVVIVVASIVWLRQHGHRTEPWTELSLAFHRMAGVTWIGRPLLLVRGMTAMLCLATGRVQIVQHGAVQWMAPHPRPLFHSAALASEVLWTGMVWQNLLAPLTQVTPLTSLVPSAVLWVVAFLGDMVWPPQVNATLHRQCQAYGVSYVIHCSRGRIQVGQWARVHYFLVLQGVLVIASFVVSIRLQRMHKKRHVEWFRKTLSNLPRALVGVQDEAFGAGDYAWLALSGLVVLQFRQRTYVFDVVLWLQQDQRRIGSEVDNGQKGSGGATNTATVETEVAACTGRIKCTKPRQPGALHRTLALSHRRWSARFRGSHMWKQYSHTAMLLVGFSYIVASLGVNISYLAVTSASSLTNDLYWADFNSTGGHTSEAGPACPRGHHSRRPGAESVDCCRGRLDGSTGVIQSRWATETVILNLRATDPCRMPWVFTQYCWVDFSRGWEMANSERRQQRCLAAESTNGAVYLEGPLRNLQTWAAWESCWGSSFEIGFARALRATQSGRRWLEQTRHASTSIVEEARLWTDTYDIQTFDLQWQNYKTVGLVETVLVRNALGLDYALTMSASRGKYRVEHSTSMKMYWGFASDLWAVATNTTLLGGASLIRNSPLFAFANVTSAMAVLENMTSIDGLSPRFAAFAATVGPFGSVDMKFVPCPDALRHMYATYMARLSSLSYDDPVALEAFRSLPTKGTVSPFPNDWVDGNISIVGGNMLCGGDLPPTPMNDVVNGWLYSGFTTTSVCAAYMAEYLVVDMFSASFALLGLLATTPTTIDVDTLCAWDSYADKSCRDVYTSTLLFLADYAAPLAPVQSLAATALAHTAPLKIGMAQFILNGSTPALYVRSLTDSTDPAWLFFGWLAMYDWVTGVREVVSFQGDVGTVAVMSTFSPSLVTSPDRAEIPTDVAFVLHWTIQYVTGIYVLVAAWIVGYTLAIRGHIESSNLFKVGRLVGRVWAGRPFIFVRSVSAMIMLSTSRLELEWRHGGERFLHLTTPPEMWYNVVLASLEVQWFVYVLNDALTCFTLEHTARYAGKSAWVVSAVVFAWKVATMSSKRVVASIDRQCAAVDMEFELHCTSGLIEIGSADQQQWFVGICLASVAVCYCLERNLAKKTFRQAPPWTSVLLSSQALYMLSFDNWHRDHVVYMDKASALLAGIITIDVRGHVFLFDIKKWQFIKLRRPDQQLAMPSRFRFAVPVSL